MKMEMVSMGMSAQFCKRFHGRYIGSRLLVHVLGALLCLGGLQFVTACGGGSGSSGGGGTSAKLSVLTTSLAGGTQGAAYSSTLLATGGSGTGYSWTISSGTPPAGITLSSGGALSGTPTAAGTANFTVKVSDSAGNSATAALSIVVGATSPLSAYEFTGDVTPVHDPSIIRQGSTYYVFSTDPGGALSGYLPIRCSTDKIAWTACGYVFSALPSWVATTVPGATNLWAPDISYFNGTYHLYYAASVFGTQESAIGLATTPTLDQTDPAYKWTDQGVVLTSAVNEDYNAIDPNILIDTDGSVWMTYGSYWNGIFQQQIDPTTGDIEPGTTYHLAERTSVAGDPEEGSSLVHNGSYYYLFVSWDTCCDANPANDNYKIAMGRSSSPHGPFLDEDGVDMLAGGGTVLLAGDGLNWSAPGGETAYIDPTGGDLMVFHALRIADNYADDLFVRTLSFDSNGWPVIGDSTVSGAAVKTTGSRQ